jgi:serine/threonine-protein kinase RsbW
MVDPEHSLSSSLPSVSESVQAGEDFVRRFLQENGFEESEQYFIGLAAREVLINAIKHGNQFDPAKEVGIRLSCKAGSLTIEITDEGDGFRLEDIADPRTPENRNRRSGRGLAIARGIMDEVLVDKIAPRGTRVRMVKHRRSR